jgi:hypothetical protein
VRCPSALQGRTLSSLGTIMAVESPLGVRPAAIWAKSASPRPSGANTRRAARANARASDAPERWLSHRDRTATAPEGAETGIRPDDNQRSRPRSRGLPVRRRCDHERRADQTPAFGVRPSSAVMLPKRDAGPLLSCGRRPRPDAPFATIRSRARRRSRRCPWCNPTAARAFHRWLLRAIWSSDVRPSPVVVTDAVLARNVVVASAPSLKGAVTRRLGPDRAVGEGV